MAAILYGFLAAVIWGAADFAGGMASRRTSVYKVVFFGWLLGAVFIPLIALISKEPMLSLKEWLYCAGAGAVAVFGLLALYGSMAKGNMSITAAVSAVSAAGLPVIAAIFFEGLPGLVTLLAILVSLVSVWLVSQDDESRENGKINLKALRVPFLSGICFGIYFILINLGSQDNVFWPMTATRTTGILVLLIFMLFTKRELLPEVKHLPLIILNVVLDVMGTVFFILSGQLGRMDVTAVLGSLYPGFTILLAWLLLKERLNRVQWAGVLLALLAIGLFSI